jgi:hypothetical protein
MNFHWWWMLVGLGAIWILGWVVSVVCMLFFDPDSASKPKPSDWGGRVIAGCVINWVLWPFLLPAFLDKRKLHRDMQTGKHPKWIVLDKEKGEENGRYWTLSDGTQFGASASGGSSTRRSHISADYRDHDELKAPIEYRVHMIAPEPQEASAWTPLLFKDRPPEPEPEDEDAVDQFVSDRYRKSVRLARGKYEVQFRVPNRSGNIEECSGVILIVADYEDYYL